MADLLFYGFWFNQSGKPVDNMLLFVCSEVIESNLVKLDTSHAVILPPMISVIWVIIAFMKEVNEGEI